MVACFPEKVSHVIFQSSMTGLEPSEKVRGGEEGRRGEGGGGCEERGRWGKSGVRVSKTFSPSLGPRQYHCRGG